VDGVRAGETAGAAEVDLWHGNVLTGAADQRVTGRVFFLRVGDESSERSRKMITGQVREFAITC